MLPSSLRPFFSLHLGRLVTWASEDAETGLIFSVCLFVAGALALDMPPPMEGLPSATAWIPPLLALLCFGAAVLFAGQAYQGHLQRRRESF